MKIAALSLKFATTLVVQLNKFTRKKKRMQQQK